MNEIETPRYQLKVEKNVIAASFHGRWNIAIDLKFMTALGVAMQSMRGKCWSMYVDMREWEMPCEVVESMQRAKVDLDRRNQVSECWQVSDEKQGYFIKPLLEKLNIPLTVCNQGEDVDTWLSKENLSLPSQFKR